MTNGETGIGTRILATLEEYLDYERSRVEAALRPHVFISYGGAGFARITAMIAAEQRFKAMGLL